MKRGDVVTLFGILVIFGGFFLLANNHLRFGGSFRAQVSSQITIGEPTIVPSDDSGNGNVLVSQRAVLSEAATLQSLSFYVVQAVGKLRLGIYDASGPSGGPGTKKAETNEITPVVGWNTAPVTSQTALEPGEYWLVYLASDNNLHFRIDFALGDAKWSPYAYGVMPGSFPGSPVSGQLHWSMYATLNSSNPLPLTPKPTLPPRAPTVNTLPPPFAGTVLVKRVGTDLSVESAPGYLTTNLAQLDNLRPTLTNGALYTERSTGSHVVYATDVSGYTETVGLCAYREGDAECKVQQFPIATECDGSYCNAPVPIIAGMVTKVIFLYLPSGTPIPVKSAPVPSNGTLGGPTNLSVVRLSTDRIYLTWKPAYAGIGIKIEESIDGKTFTEVKTVPPYYYYWTFTDMKTAGTHYFRIRAYDKSGAISSYSNIASVAIGTLSK